MANKDGPSAVKFQSETPNVEFQPEGEASASVTERVTEAAQNVNWNKVGIGVAAAAGVAGAAYAASKIIGRTSEDEGGSTGGSRKRD